MGNECAYGQWYYQHEEAEFHLYFKQGFYCRWTVTHHFIYSPAWIGKRPCPEFILPRRGWYGIEGDLVIVDAWEPMYERALQRMLANGTNYALPRELYQGWIAPNVPFEESGESDPDDEKVDFVSSSLDRTNSQDST